MPLIKGFTHKSISENIKRLVKEGYRRAQAAAIAYQIARVAKKARDKKRRK